MDKIVEKFINRKYLKKKYSSLKIESTGFRECVYIDNPILLFRFSGELKHKLGNPRRGTNIFFRGQTSDHSTFVPSIFRNVKKSTNNFKNRLDAFDKLKKILSIETNQARFKSEVGAAVLQHYGIRTPWMDFVDNLHLALWFASMERSETAPYFYSRSNQDFGYIYFIQVEYPQESCTQEIVEGNQTRWCDLRRTTNSLSLRPHNQSGVFCSRQNINSSNFAMDEFLKAVVKFPIKNFEDIIKSLEKLYTMDFMFPNKTYDNTYKSLSSKKISNLIKKVEVDYNLAENELGCIDLYK